jgi:hypothetical protein
MSRQKLIIKQQRIYKKFAKTEIMDGDGNVYGLWNMKSRTGLCRQIVIHKPYWFPTAMILYTMQRHLILRP